MITSISPTEAEKKSGHLSQSHLEQAVVAIEADGLVVLESIVPTNIIAALKTQMLSDVEKLLAREDAPFNWVRGNVQQDPPPFPPHLYREVMVNDLVIQVTHAILGNGMKNVMYSGNTAMPSGDRQPVHADSGQLWPNQRHAHPAYALVVNFPLVDMGPMNGSTEMWPGTHLDTSITMSDGDIKVDAATLDARRQVRPPIQPVVKAGSVVIRDIRMWHAGMPNRTDEPRPMIAHIHQVGWMPAGPIRFAKGSEPYLEHPILHTHAVFVDPSEIDHIQAPQRYDFVETK